VNSKDLNALISKSEKKWLSPLFLHCRDQFSGIFLPSHDEYHHYRVWHYMKQVLAEMRHAGMAVKEEMTEKAIIAAFFHDIGLVRTLDESHGMAGKEMCLEYFRNRGLAFPAGIDEILHAIEKHDDKGPGKKVQLTPGNEAANSGLSVTGPDLLSILSTGDDLDAFGYIGIYRYAEIYLLRGVSEATLPAKVLANLENRYRNLQHRCHNLTRFVSGQKDRYSRIKDFYSSGNCLQVLSFIKRALREQRSLPDPNCLQTIQDENINIQEFIRQVHQENSLFPYP